MVTFLWIRELRSYLEFEGNCLTQIKAVCLRLSDQNQYMTLVFAVCSNGCCQEASRTLSGGLQTLEEWKRLGCFLCECLIPFNTQTRSSRGCVRIVCFSVELRKSDYNPHPLPPHQKGTEKLHFFKFLNDWFEGSPTPNSKDFLSKPLPAQPLWNSQHSLFLTVRAVEI